MDDRSLVRHLAATLAYRASKVLRDVEPGFATLSVAPTTRRPVLVVAHMADLMAWALTVCDGRPTWSAAGSDDWPAEVSRFFAGLDALDRRLSESPVDEESLRTLIQGPLADALTHVGQLAMLRGMAGSPVRPESYARAEIVEGRVGIDQAPPGREFDGDASVPR
jgi:hypothetical protein